MAIPGAIPAPGDSLPRVIDAVRHLFQNGAPASAGGGESAQAFDLLAPHEALVLNQASNSTVTVAATAVVLFDSSGTAKRFAPLSVTVNLAASGAAGLDTGAEAANTWYTVWGIGQEGGTVSAVASASASAPTLPSGYTYSGKLGLFRNNGSSNIVPFFQRGINVSQNLASEALSGGSATNYTTVDLSAHVPPIAKTVLLRANLYTSAGAHDIVAEVSGGGSVQAATYGKTVLRGQAMSSTWGMTDMVNVLMNTPQQVSYWLAGTNARLDFGVSGWTY